MASKSISKSVIWQLGGKFALQGIAFFTTPIFTRLLMPADYGYTALYASWLAIFELIEGVGVASSIGNARIKYGEDNLPQFLSSIMTMALISFVVSLILVFSLNKIFSSFLGLTPLMTILVVVQAFFSFVISFEITRLDVLKKVEKSTFLSITQTIFVITISLLLVLNSKENRGQAKIYGQAIPTIIYGIIILLFVYFRGKKIWICEYNKFSITFALPLIIHACGHLIFCQSDRIMLQKMQGADVLGIYSVAFSLCYVLTIIYGALNIAWNPFYYDYKKNNDNEQIILHSKRYIKFFSCLTIGFILLSYDVYKLMAPAEYYKGMEIIPIFVVSNYFAFLYLFPVNFEFYKEKTTLIPVVTFVVAIMNILINWWLIPTYGIVGAAIGTLTAHIVLFLLHDFSARVIVKEYEYPWHIYLPGLIIVISTVIGTVFFKDLFYVRWILALFIGIYMLRDLYTNKSIF